MTTADSRDDLRPTERFSDRVEDYVRFRPTYPVDVVRTLEREAGVAPVRTRVVDLGCGTGIFSALLLAEGYAVTGVEPNAEMRGAAVARLSASPRFRAIAGRAERVPLPDACCDLIVAAQAFHWFDLRAARSEMQRLLTPGGLVALVWNDRRPDSSPFACEYEEILQRFGTDYARVAHRNRSEADLQRFFGPEGCRRRVFHSRQEFDLAGLKGRARSSSYVPRAGDPRHDAILNALTEAFERHAAAGVVRLEYETRLYFGGLS